MNQATKLYPADVLTELMYEDMVEEGEYHLKMLEWVFSHQSRWSIYFGYIFKDVTTGKYYTFTYGQGATEEQEDDGFLTENSEGNVKCFEVAPEEIVKIQYKPVEE